MAVELYRSLPSNRTPGNPVVTEPKSPAEVREENLAFCRSVGQDAVCLARSVWGWIEFRVLGFRGSPVTYKQVVGHCVILGAAGLVQRSRQTIQKKVKGLRASAHARIRQPKAWPASGALHPALGRFRGSLLSVYYNMP